MIKTKFGFFQVQVESMCRYAIELCQTSFCKAPEGFDAIDMPFTTGKFVIIMMHFEVLIKAKIDQSVITAPAIRVNHSIRCAMSTDNGLQCCFGAIRNNLCINLSLTLEYTKDDCFAIGAPTSFPRTRCAPK